MGRKLTEIPEEVALQAMQMWFKGSSKEEVAKTLGLAPSRVGYASVKGVRLATEFMAAAEARRYGYTKSYPIKHRSDRFRESSGHEELVRGSRQAASTNEKARLNRAFFSSWCYLLV
jgi:hypothetical protein